eukprot:66247-Amphidinium_carterae.1
MSPISLSRRTAGRALICFETSWLEDWRCRAKKKDSHYSLLLRALCFKVLGSKKRENHRITTNSENKNHNYIFQDPQKHPKK